MGGRVRAAWHAAVVADFSNGKQDAAVMPKMTAIVPGMTAGTQAFYRIPSRPRRRVTSI